MSRFVASHQVGRLIISIAQGHDCTREHGDVVAGSVLVDVARRFTDCETPYARVVVAWFVLPFDGNPSAVDSSTVRTRS
eukprot:1177840-Prorocentrum_minimum.AAC.2